MRRAPQDKVAECVLVFSRYADCPACKKALNSMVTRLEDFILFNAPDWGSYDVLIDPDVHLYSASGRKRKLDEGWADAVCSNAIADGRSSSSSNVMQVLGVEGAKDLARELDLSVLADFRASTKLSFVNDPLHTYSIQWDGVRVGNPAVELLASYLWNGRKKICVALQPVVDTNFASQTAI